jgi:membrane peptidoglycan carboxypeptidase
VRPAAAGPAGFAQAPGFAEAPGYGSTLQRDRTGPRGGNRPQDSRRGRDRRGGRDGGGGYDDGGGGYEPENGGRGFRAWLLHGSWWRHWSWRKAAAIVATAFALMTLVVVAGVVYAYHKTEIPTAVSEAALQQSSSVYFSDGTSRVGSFSADDIHRQLLKSSQIPPVLRNAVIAAEDQHFFTEGGISPTGILRAAYEDVSGGTFQGGSTITQQFVRNYYATIGTAQTASRKMKEILVAVKLSHVESKDWILTNYLNTVFLGDTAYGVGAASQIYFNKPAAKLDVSQAAMLAAMINEPGFFSPDPSAGAAYSQLVKRWTYVLGNMVKDGSLSGAQASAQKFPKIVHGQVLNGSTGYRGYIMEAVQNELESLYGYTLQQIDSRGLRIVTTFNKSMMNTLYQTVAQAKQQMATGGQALPSWAHVGVVLEKPGSGAIQAMYGGPGTSVRHCLKLKCAENMAMESRNQVGSSFKPYVLAAAVHLNMNAKTSVLDGYSYICSPSDAFPGVLSLTVGGTSCPPSQYGYFNFQSPGESNGPVSAAKASALSLNTAYGDLIHRVGTQKVIDIAQAFGVNTGTYPNGSSLQAMKGESGIALGQASLTVEEQATTFATLADGGEYYTPHVIAKITQSSGMTVPSKVQHHRVLTPTQAADVDWALSYDTIYGTAVPNAVLSTFRPTIAKTGTTNVAQDAFFIGAVPQYSLAVGIFTNNQTQAPTAKQTLNILPTINGQAGGFGGAWPATIWRLYMTNEFSQLPVQQLATPDFTGFDKWVQVVPKPKKPRNPGPSCGRPHGRGGGVGSPCPTPNPTPNPTPSCGPNPVTPCSGPTPTPAPTPTLTPSPTPSPTCTPSFGNMCPPTTPPPGPGTQQRAGAAAQAADELAGISAGRLVR